ncbi:MAG: polysaccharide pyruvyl transferase family protein [Candidatus Competibacteraceae bacterium]|nr:polysaccharide pyruvyl transferase family protein [Candidatus Competibacteraceae bacterium]
MITTIGGNIVNTISEDELKLLSFFDDHSTFLGGGRNNYFKEKLNLFLPPIFPKLKDKIVDKFYKKNNSYLIPESWKNFETSAIKIIDNKRLYQRMITYIEEMDVAVIHGNGCMVGNGILPRTQLFLSFLIKKYFNKPVIILNHTADFNHPNLLKIAQEIYPLFDDITFRDPVSKERCRKICNGRFVPDTAFLFEPAAAQIWKPLASRPTFFDVWPDVAQFNPQNPYICLGGSSVFSYDLFPSEIINDYSSLIAYLKTKYSGQIVLTASDIIDQPIFRAIAKKFDLPLIGLTTPVQQAIDIVGNAEAYLGGRWHPSIFALRGGTPVIPFTSKTFKMEALVKMAGSCSSTFNALCLNDSKKEIAMQLLKYVDQGNELRVKIRDWAQNISKDSWDNVMFIKNKLC